MEEKLSERKHTLCEPDASPVGAAEVPAKDKSGFTSLDKHKEAF